MSDNHLITSSTKWRLVKSAGFLTSSPPFFVTESELSVKIGCFFKKETQLLRIYSRETGKIEII